MNKPIDSALLRRCVTWVTDPDSYPTARPPEEHGPPAPRTRGESPFDVPPEASVSLQDQIQAAYALLDVARKDYGSREAAVASGLLHLLLRWEFRAPLRSEGSDPEHLLAALEDELRDL